MCIVVINMLYMIVCCIYYYGDKIYVCDFIGCIYYMYCCDKKEVWCCFCCLFYVK